MKRFWFIFSFFCALVGGVSVLQFELNGQSASLLIGAVVTLIVGLVGRDAPTFEDWEKELDRLEYLQLEAKKTAGQAQGTAPTGAGSNDYIR